MRVLFFIFLYIVVVAAQVPGGWSRIQRGSAQVHRIFDEITPDLRNRTKSCSEDTLELRYYRSQVVNGENYLGLVEVHKPNTQVDCFGVRFYWGPAYNPSAELIAWKEVNCDWDPQPWNY